MLTPDNVTLEEYQTALAREEATHARVRFIVDGIVFQDEELEQGGIQLSTYMNPDDKMTFGIAYSTEAIVHILKSDKTEAVDFSHEFTIELGVEINGVTEWVNVGRFSGNKPTQNLLDDTIELVAYDRMKRFDVDINDFIKTLTFPCTIQDIYDELCEYIAINNTVGDEIGYVMSRQITDTDNWPFITCRELLAAIAEANGCYAKVTTDGEVQFVWFSDHTSDESLTRDNCFGGTIIRLDKTQSRKWGSVENLFWKDVETLKYSEFDNENNPFKYSYARFIWNEVNEGEQVTDVVQPAYDPYHNHRLWANVENIQWGNAESFRWSEFEYFDDIAGTIYTIMNNPFIMYDTEADIKAHLQLILDKLYAVHLYYVASIIMVGNWLVEPGDIVQLEVMPNTFTEYPIFNRVLSWNGSCTCNYETTGSLS